jgi:hypothetical protein
MLTYPQVRRASQPPLSRSKTTITTIGNRLLSNRMDGMRDSFLRTGALAVYRLPEMGRE